MWILTSLRDGLRYTTRKLQVCIGSIHNGIHGSRSDVPIGYQQCDTILQDDFRLWLVCHCARITFVYK